jgi:hypothetical protein
MAGDDVVVGDDDGVLAGDDVAIAPSAEPGKLDVWCFPPGADGSMAGGAGRAEGSMAGGDTAGADPSTNAPLVAAHGPRLFPELRRWLVARLPEPMVPTSWVLHARLPRLPSGKLDRDSLPSPDDGRPAVAAPYVEPRPGAESALAAIWADALGIERCGRDDDFFELGGGSLATIEVVAAARARGLALSPELVFQFPTVAALAAAIGDPP